MIINLSCFKIRLGERTKLFGFGVVTKEIQGFTVWQGEDQWFFTWRY
jgi:hypothetical protein